MQLSVRQLLDALNQVLLGKDEQVRLALCCMIARGHLLIEDLPGMGKTTLSQALAKVSGLAYKRIQFTSDLLPADITGANVFERSGDGAGTFRFVPGPVFAEVVLADEINRATPKAQSALLEAMEERQVSVDGKTYPLPDAFFVIATQNPLSQAGTFPLPESQLDRFLMRISLGYPSEQAERELLEGKSRSDLLNTMAAVVQPETLLQFQRSARQVKASASVLDYLQRLVAWTRQHPKLAYGLSPRAALSLLAAARSWAYMHGREYLLPEDIQAVFAAVVEHRLSDAADHAMGQIAAQALQDVRVV
ncbi:MAG: MoxR family ATPase [Oceanospirillaceae bacterium]|nr:MoxR family ATPase [Oceanospirillaceae bacterium]